MSISKNDSQWCGLHIGILKSQVEKFKYLDSVAIDNRKCDMKIQNHIGIAKDAFQNLSKVLRHRKISSEKRRDLKQQRCRQMLIILWTEYMNNKEVLRNI